MPTNLGFSGGCNIGIRYLLEKDYDLILLLNNDAEVAPDCLEKLTDAATLTDAAAYTGTIYESAAPSRIWYSGGTLNLLTLDARHAIKAPLPNELPRPTEFISGCCLLMTAGALREIGLLDEKFFAYYEDLDWCLRAKHARRKLVYVPQANIYHNVSHSFKRAGSTNDRPTGSRWTQKRPIVLYLSYRNRAILSKKHASGSIHLAFLLARLTMRAAAHLVMLLLAQQGQRARAVLHGIGGGILGQPGTPEIDRYL